MREDSPAESILQSNLPKISPMSVPFLNGENLEANNSTSETNFVILLTHTNVIARCFNASVAVGFDLTCALFLTSCVNVGSDLRKTPGTW
jgi:hypothetical protein